MFVAIDDCYLAGNTFVTSTNSVLFPNYTMASRMLVSQNEAAVYYLDGYITVIRLPDWSRAFHHDISTQITYGYLVLRIQLTFKSFRTRSSTRVGMDTRWDGTLCFVLTYVIFVNVQMFICCYITGIPFCLLVSLLRHQQTVYYSLIELPF